MFGNKRLKAEIVRLSYRVAELEERLCPCEQHDWKRTGVDYSYDGTGGCDAMYNYKCARCGKKMRSFQPYGKFVRWNRRFPADLGAAERTRDVSMGQRD